MGVYYFLSAFSFVIRMLQPIHLVLWPQQSDFKTKYQGMSSDTSPDLGTGYLKLGQKQQFGVWGDDCCSNGNPICYICIRTTQYTHGSQERLRNTHPTLICNFKAINIG